jgi:hypothetical protein
MTFSSSSSSSSSVVGPSNKSANINNPNHKPSSQPNANTNPNSLFPMSVPQVRKNLQIMRTAWAQHSPESIFYPSAPLPPSVPGSNLTCSYELFSYHQVKGNHNKRHLKRKSIPFQLTTSNSTVVFEKEEE